MPLPTENPLKISIAGYLALRLEEIGLMDYFAIPGDYNLVLLDELLKHKNLRACYCCNELNAGYAADGYARVHGIAAAFVTYSVGGLSIINAAAGAYAEDLPVVFVSGSPNTNAQPNHQLLHHTLGVCNYDYVRQLFEKVTVDAITILDKDSAASQIDHALTRALHFRKPVYIEIPCNVANIQITTPSCQLVPIQVLSSKNTLKTAIMHAASILNLAVKPVLVAGPKIRAFDSEAAFKKLAIASGYAYANQPQAKSFVDESHAQYIGTFWGAVSSPGCGEIVDSSDLCIYVGVVLTDYSSCGNTVIINSEKSIVVNPTAVKIQNSVYSQINMVDFLNGLSLHLNKNDTSLIAYKRIQGEAPPVKRPSKNAELSTRYVFSQIEKLLDKNTTIIAETGDSWFNAMRLKLPKGCGLEIQLQYGSIGWSVGATLGVQAAFLQKRRVIALIGDGSFQMSAQEISTMIRYDLKPIIFLFNNKGYTIEVEIHDGPYNAINNWNYTQLVEAFNHDQNKCFIKKASTVDAFDKAIKAAKHFDGLCFIEVHLHPDDCNKNLLKWGAYVAKENSRKPRVF